MKYNYYNNDNNKQKPRKENTKRRQNAMAKAMRTIAHYEPDNPQHPTDSLSFSVKKNISKSHATTKIYWPNKIRHNLNWLKTYGLNSCNNTNRTTHQSD